LDFLESLGLVDRKSSIDVSPADAAHEKQLFSESLLDKYQHSEIGQSESGGDTFQLTPKGREAALKIWDQMESEEKTKMIKLKKKFNAVNLKQFLRYVYKYHPDYTTSSEIINYIRN